MRNRCSHLSECGQPVPQALAFLELLDPGQVFEEHRSADHTVGVVSNQCQRVTDDLSRQPEPQLSSIRQQMQLEHVREKAHHFGLIP